MQVELHCHNMVVPVMLQVSDLENYQKSLDKGLEDEVAEKALAEMRQTPVLWQGWRAAQRAPRHYKAD